MEEKLVGVQVAKLAKEKGFDEPCKKLWANYYTGEPSNKWKLINEDSDIVGISFMEWKAPRQSSLALWLERKHSIYMDVKTNTTPNEILDFEIRLKSWKFPPIYVDVFLDKYEGIEEALQRALKEIELCT
jgi:hypothetical protein